MDFPAGRRPCKTTRGTTMTQQFSRRDVLLAAAAGLAAGGSGSWVLAAQEDSPAGIPTRPLGKTGEKVSIVGLGGWHIGSDARRPKPSRLMHEAIDEGMTFFDNAWDYHDGRSEEVMGKALADGGRRDKVFLMTKVCDRDYAGRRRSTSKTASAGCRPTASTSGSSTRSTTPTTPTGSSTSGGAEGGPGGPQGGQGPLHRLHRPQGHRPPPEDARQAVRVGHGADADQHPRRPLPQLPEGGRARVQPPRRSA